MQLKGLHGNGLLGHGKRRKAFSLHCDKLARHVMADNCFGVIFSLLLWFSLTLLPLDCRILRRSLIESEAKTRIRWFFMSALNWWWLVVECFCFCCFRSDIIIIVWWGGWTSCWVQDYVWMQKTLKIPMLQCFDGNANATGLTFYLKFHSLYALKTLWEGIYWN